MTPSAPYMGLVPYTEADAALFFGRDRERALIEANLMAARLTVLYGPSGVGKTSVLHAAVVHDLRAQALRNFQTYGAPEFAVAVVSEWSGDPVAAIELAVHDGALAALGAGPGAAAQTAGDLSQTLRTWGERLNGELLLVLDQFEEYFLYHHGTATDERFVAQISRAVCDPTVPVRVLISLREDALSQLDRFKGQIPGLFDNYLRIDRLDRDSARRAIEGPLESINACAGGQPPVTLEPGLIDEVLDQVQTGRVSFHREAAADGAASSPTSGAQARIDTPYLQLVMQRLWLEDIVGDGRRLQRATLSRLGGADRIVRTHLDGVMASLPTEVCETAVAVFHHLVTPSGMKIAHSAADLSQYTQQPEDRVQRLLDALSSGSARVLRPVASSSEHKARRYEIHHDVLAAAILDWRRRFRQDQDKLEAAQLLRRNRKLGFSVAAVLAVFILQFVLTLGRSSRSDQVFTSFATVQVKPPVAPVVAAAAAPGPTPASPAQVTSLLREKLAGDLASGQLQLIEAGGRSVAIRMPSDGLFDSGTAALNAQATPLLARIGNALAQTSGPVGIVGHTDSTPIRSLQFPSNWHLSQARAAAIVAGLGGIEGGRFRAEGRADAEPVAPNQTAAGRAQNRRIEIIIPTGAAS